MGCVRLLVCQPHNSMKNLFSLHFEKQPKNIIKICFTNHIELFLYFIKHFGTSRKNCVDENHRAVEGIPLACAVSIFVWCQATDTHLFVYGISRK